MKMVKHLKVPVDKGHLQSPPLQRKGLTWAPWQRFSVLRYRAVPWDYASLDGIIPCSFLGIVLAGEWRDWAGVKHEDWELSRPSTGTAGSLVLVTALTDGLSFSGVREALGVIRASGGAGCRQGRGTGLAYPSRLGVHTSHAEEEAEGLQRWLADEGGSCQVSGTLLLPPARTPAHSPC